MGLAQHCFRRPGAGRVGSVAAGPANNTFPAAGCLGRGARVAGDGTAPATPPQVWPHDCRLARTPGSASTGQMVSQRADDQQHSDDLATTSAHAGTLVSYAVLALRRFMAVDQAKLLIRRD